MYTEVDSQSGESQSAFIYSDFTKNMRHTNVEIEAVLQGEADMQHQRSGIDHPRQEGNPGKLCTEGGETTLE